MTKKPNDESARRLAAEIEYMKLHSSKFTLKIERTHPEFVDVPQRLRSLRQDKVDQLAESMAALGLQQPITVWSEAGDHLELVAGAHRLAAALKLGWVWIDCIFADGMTDIDRQLWEIDENLQRAELSPAEMAEHLAKRKELWVAHIAAQQTGKSLPSLEGRGNKGFASDTAEKTGMSKRAINLATSRAKAIPSDIRDQIKGTKLDTGVYLDSLKGMDPDDQRAQVTTDLAEGVKPKIPKAPKPDLIAPPPKPEKTYLTVDRDGVEAELQNLEWRWNQASREAQRRFKKWVNGQIIDDETSDA